MTWGQENEQSQQKGNKQRSNKGLYLKVFFQMGPHYLP